MTELLRSNSALVSDACLAALRALRRAPQRERYMARSAFALLLAITYAVVIATSMATAQGFDTVQIDKTQCALVTSGSGNLDVIARGEKKFEHCAIQLPIEEFHKRYSFCALSGVLATKGRVICEFGYADNTRTRVFFMSGPDELCEFVCVRK